METEDIGFLVAHKFKEEIGRLRGVILNIQALAERGFPIDTTKLATRCRLALTSEKRQEPNT